MYAKIAILLATISFCSHAQGSQVLTFRSTENVVDLTAGYSIGWDIVEYDASDFEPFPFNLSITLWQLWGSNTSDPYNFAPFERRIATNLNTSQSFYTVPPQWVPTVGYYRFEAIYLYDQLAISDSFLVKKWATANATIDNIPWVASTTPPSTSSTTSSSSQQAVDTDKFPVKAVVLFVTLPIIISVVAVAAYYKHWVTKKRRREQALAMATAARIEMQPRQAHGEQLPMYTDDESAVRSQRQPEVLVGDQAPPPAYKP